MIDCREIYKAEIKQPDGIYCILVAAEDIVQAAQAVESTYNVPAKDVHIEPVVPETDVRDWVPPWSPCEWCDCYDDHDSKMPCQHSDGPCYPARRWSRLSPGKSPEWLDMVTCPCCKNHAHKRIHCGACGGTGYVRRDGPINTTTCQEPWQRFDGELCNKCGYYHDVGNPCPPIQYTRNKAAQAGEES